MAYYELGPLCLLLSNLLCFNGMSVLLPKGELCDRDIIQDYVEVVGSLGEYPPNISADNLQCTNDGIVPGPMHEV